MAQRYINIGSSCTNIDYAGRPSDLVLDTVCIINGSDQNTSFPLRNSNPGSSGFPIGTNVTSNVVNYSDYVFKIWFDENLIFSGSNKSFWRYISPNSANSIPSAISGIDTTIRPFTDNQNYISQSSLNSASSIFSVCHPATSTTPFSIVHTSHSLFENIIRRMLQLPVSTGFYLINGSNYLIWNGTALSTSLNSGTTFFFIKFLEGTPTNKVCLGISNSSSSTTPIPGIYVDSSLNVIVNGTQYTRTTTAPPPANPYPTTPTQTITGNLNLPTQISFDNLGNIAVANNGWSNVHVFIKNSGSYSTGNFIKSIPTSGTATGVSFDPNRNILVGSGTIVNWLTASGSGSSTTYTSCCTSTISGGAEHIRPHGTSGNFVVSSRISSFVTYVTKNASTLTPSNEISISGSGYTSIDVAGNLIVSHTFSSSVFIFKTRGGSSYTVNVGATPGAYSVALSSDGFILAYPKYSSSQLVYHINTGSGFTSTSKGTFTVNSQPYFVRFNPNGNRLVCGCINGNSVHIFDRSGSGTNTILSQIQSIALSGPARCISIDSSNNIAIGDNVNNRIYFFAAN